MPELSQHKLIRAGILIAGVVCLAVGVKFDGPNFHWGVLTFLLLGVAILILREYL